MTKDNEYKNETGLDWKSHHDNPTIEYVMWLENQAKEKDERIKELETLLSTILKDGKGSESAIRFEVLTGRYYYDKIKELLNQ